MHPGTCPDGLACKTYLIFNDDFGDVSQLAVATLLGCEVHGGDVSQLAVALRVVQRRMRSHTAAFLSLPTDCATTESVTLFSSPLSPRTTAFLDIVTARATTESDSLFGFG